MQPTAGAVLYAADATRLSAFYARVAGLEPHHAVDEYVQLRFANFELVILTTRQSRAAGGDAAHPPPRRADVAIKPVFYVPDLAVARTIAAELGGGVESAAAEWPFENSTVCDGFDPEGNVFQLRALR
ncbi:MAG TPA: VOC family protein [Gemmatimonadaceae bacterium]|jgi:predicted enzyme related to lactoylglutathione lyase